MINLTFKQNQKQCFEFNLKKKHPNSFLNTFFLIIKFENIVLCFRQLTNSSVVVC